MKEITVHMEPDISNPKDSQYFWMICENNSNIGHGWAESPEDAFKKANLTYSLFHSEKVQE